MEKQALSTLIKNKTLYFPWHKYQTDTQYITNYKNIYENTKKLFLDKKSQKTEPAYTIFRSICYAFVLNRYFNISLNKCFTNKELLFDNRFYNYKKYKNIYKKLLKEIICPELYISTISVMNECKKEYGIDIIPNKVKGCFITPENKIIYLTHYIYHTNYLVYKFNIKLHKQHSYMQDLPEIINKYVNNGWIRISTERYTLSITSCSKLSTLQKKLILNFYKKYILKDMPVNNFDLFGKFIFEKEFDSNKYTIYDSLKDLFLDN